MGEGYIFLPGTKQNLAIADIVNMWNKSILSHERDPDSSSASNTSKNEQDANTTWKEQWDSFLQYTDETANPAAVLARPLLWIRILWTWICWSWIRWSWIFQARICWSWILQAWILQAWILWPGTLWPWILSWLEGRRRIV